MRGLVRRDDAGERVRVAGEVALRDGLRVELGLEVLERQREVEDRDVARRNRRSRRKRRQRAHDGTAADDGACAEAGLAQKRCARGGIDVLRGLLDGAVAVHVFERPEIGHVALLLSSRGG